jgi:hypothetical protein
VRGVGLSVVVVPVLAVAFIGLERSEVPHASILTRIAQQVGGSFGTAVRAVILAATHSFGQAFWWSSGFTGVAVALPGRPEPTPVPVIPAPVIPAPVIPAPVIPAPVIPAPVIPAPVIPAPVIPAPAGISGPPASDG